MKRVLQHCLPVLMVIIVGGCTSTPSLYDWGEYESLIHDMYVEPAKASPEIQIQALNRLVIKSTEKGQKVAPGIYAHLGMMYAANGDSTLSQQAFEQEMLLYPESSTLINGMLTRANKAINTTEAQQ